MVQSSRHDVDKAQIQIPLEKRDCIQRGHREAKGKRGAAGTAFDQRLSGLASHFIVNSEIDLGEGKRSKFAIKQNISASAIMKKLKKTKYKVTKQIVNLANIHSKGRVISFLEGGYDLQALSESIKQHLLALKN